MAVKTKDELLTEYRELVGADLTDEQIAFVENITDTITDYETKANNDGENWKAKYEENDAMWKKKYTERFFSKDSTDDEDKPNSDTPPKKLMTFDDLFSTKGDK